MKIGRNESCPCGSEKKWKKCCIAAHPRSISQTLSKYFGKDWIEERLKKIKRDGFTNLNPMNIHAMNIHPIIRAIDATVAKLASAKKRGRTPVAMGAAEMRQSILHHNLSTLESDFLDFSDLQHRLRGNEFEKVEYEIAIAAGYKRMGNRIDFVPRATTRTGEFTVTDVHGTSVLIECKKKDMVSPKMARISSWWDDFQHRLTQKMRKMGKAYGIIIHIPVNPDNGDIQKLLDVMVQDLINEFVGEKMYLEKYRVEFRPFPMGKPVPLSDVESFGDGCDHKVSIMTQDKRAWPLGEHLAKTVSNPIKICGKQPSDFLEEKVKGVLSTLGEAYGQLEEGKPNIVYIDVNSPSMMAEKTEALMRLLPSAIQKKLKTDYSKVSAVVLTNLKVLGNTELAGFEGREEIIRNPKAQNPLPASFQVYGDGKQGKRILRDIHELPLFE